MDNQQRPKQYFPDPEHQTQYYEPEAYYEPQSYYEPEPQRSNGLAIGLGIALAIALCAGTVLFFLWRGAAAEADKPPVTSTVTETAVTTETVTETTTKRPKLLPDRGRGESGETVAPTEPAVEVPTELRGLFDDIVSGAESALQGQ